MKKIFVLSAGRSDYDRFLPILEELIFSTIIFGSNISYALIEIEPFKTAITSYFNRGLPYVIYASLLLLLGIFSERFFCRFICPLGAVLAFLGRIHILKN